VQNLRKVIKNTAYRVSLYITCDARIVQRHVIDVAELLYALGRKISFSLI